MEDDKAVAVSIPDSARGFIGVYLHGSETAILGQLILKPDLVFFSPVLPFRPGKSYQIKLSNGVVMPFSIPANRSLKPEILHIYPTLDTLPENTLKFYIEFSQPMQAGKSDQFISVSKQNGEMISPFLNLQPELWNADNTILTLWLDPGRIKKKLLRHEKLGKPLEQGFIYTLEINTDWLSQNGLKLTNSFTKTFIVDDPITVALSLNNWKLSIPEKGTNDPLHIDFGQPLDHQLILETIKINGVSGSLETIDTDRSVLFTPKSTWTPGTYQITVDPKLEDLAGNNFHRPFDRDVQTQKVVTAPKQTITFKIN